MLSQAAKLLQPSELQRCILSVADMAARAFSGRLRRYGGRRMEFLLFGCLGARPLAGGIENGIAEALRVLRPGGMIILFENFGTGSETPAPPPHLNGYFEYLNEKGISNRLDPHGLQL